MSVANNSRPEHVAVWGPPRRRQDYGVCECVRFTHRQRLFAWVRPRGVSQVTFVLSACVCVCVDTCMCMGLSMGSAESGHAVLMASASVRCRAVCEREACEVCGGTLTRHWQCGGVWEFRTSLWAGSNRSNRSTCMRGGDSAFERHPTHAHTHTHPNSVPRLY